MHSNMHFNWLDYLEIGFFVLLIVLALIIFFRFFVLRRVGITNDRKTPTQLIQSWNQIPEILLIVLSLPLQLLWEIAQFPLYTVWHEGEWSYILYGLVHCTLGDLLILLNVYWLVSIFNRSRRWIFSPSMPNIVLFTILGLSYTIFSEILNTRIKGTWGYTELMPIVPVIEVGGMPFLQWLLIPPILIWLMQIMRPSHNI